MNMDDLELEEKSPHSESDSESSQKRHHARGCSGSNPDERRFSPSNDSHED